MKDEAKTKEQLINELTELRLRVAELEHADSESGTAYTSNRTKRKLLEEENQNKAALLENASDAILMLDMEGNFLYFNNSLMRMTGYTREELLARRLYDIEPTEYAEKVISNLVLIMDKGEALFESAYLRKDGTILPIEVHAIVSRIAAKNVVISSVRDISELKQAKEKLKEALEGLETRIQERTAELYSVNRALETEIEERKQTERLLREEKDFSTSVINKTPAIICGIAQEGATTFINPAGQTITGYNPEELIGRNWWTTFYPGDEYRQVEQLFRDFKKGNVRDYEMTLTTRDGNKRTISWNSLNRFDSDGNIVEVIGFGNDITERKRVEETLKKNQENLRHLIDLNPVAMLVSDKSDNVIFFNNKFIETFGYTLEDIPTIDDWWPLAYPDKEYRQEVISSWRTAANKAIKDRKQMDPQEWRVTCKDGSTRDIEFRMSSIPDMNIIIFNDITESKQSKEQMKAANELLKNIIEFLPDATFIIDKDKRIIAWNHAIEEMTGVAKKDIIERDHYFAAVPFYGEPRPYLIDLVGMDDKELASKYIYVKKKRDVLYAEAFAPALNNGKGAYIWATASPLFDTSGNMIGAIESIRDISDRKSFEDALLASEEKYRTLFEESKDAVFMSTPEGKYLDINQAGIELFGYPSKEELLAIDITNDVYFNPEDRETYKRMLYEQGFVKDYEIQMKRKDGKKLSILSTSSVVRDEHGAIKAYRGIMRDVTEHKSLEQELHHSQKMQAIGQLAGGIAHDFNNLLTGIIGYSDLELMKLPENTATAKNIKVIRDAGEKAASLVKQIMAFSRKQVLEMGIVNLNTIVEDMGKLLTRTIGENISLELNIKTQVENIMADPGQIGQILLNLAINARDAMPSGGRMIIETADVYLDEDFIKTRRGVAAGNYVLLSVTDTGHGMSREMQDRIFEPFFTTKESGKGTGLGLSTVYGIVQQHNGYIWVYSEKGKGSTFKIYMPAAKGETKEAEKPASIITSGAETILVVDDEPDIRRFVFDMLQPLGYKVLDASCADEALRISNEIQDKIDLLLTDFTMPGMNGLELRKSFLKKWPAIKVIVMSGYGDEAITDKSIKKDDIIFLQKPLTYMKLATKLRDVLNTK